jgi:hypothetical protein
VNEGDQGGSGGIRGSSRLPDDHAHPHSHSHSRSHFYSNSLLHSHSHSPHSGPARAARGPADPRSRAGEDPRGRGAEGRGARGEEPKPWGAGEPGSRGAERPVMARPWETRTLTVSQLQQLIGSWAQRLRGSEAPTLNQPATHPCLPFTFTPINSFPTSPNQLPQTRSGDAAPRGPSRSWMRAEEGESG